MANLYWVGGSGTWDAEDLTVASNSDDPSVLQMRIENTSVVAQIFSPSQDCALASATFRVNGVSEFDVGTFVAELYVYSGGLPSESALAATSEAKDWANGDITFNFSGNPIYLNDASNYWIALRVVSNDPFDLMNVACGDTAVSGQSALYDNDTDTWEDGDRTIWFQVNARQHWSYSSGGLADAPNPTITDPVYFDSNSGLSGATITIVNADCGGATFNSGHTYDIVGDGANMRVYGSLYLEPTLSFNLGLDEDSAGFLELVGEEGGVLTLTTNGVRINTNTIQWVAGGGTTYSMVDDLSTPAALDIYCEIDSTIDTNGFNINADCIQGAGDGRLELRDSVLSLVGVGNRFRNIEVDLDEQELIINGQDATIICYDSYATEIEDPDFGGAGGIRNTYGGIVVGPNSVIGNAIMYVPHYSETPSRYVNLQFSGVFGNLSIEDGVLGGNTDSTDFFSGCDIYWDYPVISGTLSTYGSSGAQLFMNGAFTAANHRGAYLNIRDHDATGTATPLAAWQEVYDYGGNTGWQFMPKYIEVI